MSESDNSTDNLELQYVDVVVQGDQRAIIPNPHTVVHHVNHNREMASIFGRTDIPPEALIEQVPVTPDLTFTFKEIRRVR